MINMNRLHLFMPFHATSFLFC